MSRRELHWEFLDRVPYREAVRLQEEAREAVKRGEGVERLFLLEHPHVYTLGRNATPADLLLDSTALDACGIELAECDRGGQVTYHGPGQLVGYPVVNLSPDRRDIRRYVRDLQAAIIETLASYGLEGTVLEGQEMVGVWVGRAKIASIGVHLSRWVTTHGFALNVTTDLSYFQGIVACGLPGVEMTSLERLLGEAPPLAEVAERFAGALAPRLERAAVPTVSRPRPGGAVYNRLRPTAAARSSPVEDPSCPEEPSTSASTPPSSPSPTRCPASSSFAPAGRVSRRR